MLNFRRSLLLIGLVLACGTLPALAQEGGAPKLQVSEKPLATLPEGDVLRSIAISADSSRVAVLVRVEKEGADGKKVQRYAVSTNGVNEKEYEWIAPGSLTFSADGSLTAYVVQEGGKMFAVVGGKEHPRFHEVINSQLQGAPAGNRFAYYARLAAGGKMMVVIDGQDSPEYDLVGNIIFSPDGTRVAYGAEVGGKQFFVVDGRQLEVHERVAGPSFVWSPDGKRHAYGVVAEGKVKLLVDGKVMAEAKEASRPVFSPDSQRIAFSVQRNGKMLAVIDGEEQKEYDGVGGETIVFSPDSKRVAYLASRKAEAGNKLFYVVDGQELPSYDQLIPNAFIFSPDSKRMAFMGVKNNRYVAVIDGIEGKEYEEMRLAQFSPDSAKMAYLGKRNNQAFAVVNNSEGIGYASVANLLFSPDGQHMAYAAARESDNKNFVVVDGMEGKAYDGIVPETMQFTSDSKHLVYEARLEDKPRFVVGKAETAEHGGTLRGSRIVLDGPAAFHALVLRDKTKVVKMDVKIE